MHGIFFLLVQNVVVGISALIFNIYFARSIDPVLLGNLAIATSVYSFFQVLSDMGLSQAYIQNAKDDRNALFSILSVTTFSSIALGFVCIYFSEFFADIVGDKNVAPLISAYAAVLVVQQIVAVAQAKFQTQLDFKRISRQTILASPASCLIGYYALLNNAGVFSAIIQVFSFFAIIVLLNSFFFHSFFMGCKFKLSPLAPYKKYAGEITCYTLFKFITRNADIILIGWRYGAHSLGLYVLGLRLFYGPIRLIQSSISNYLFVIASRKRNNTNLLALRFVLTAKFINVIVLPFCVLIYFTASPVIEILFGQKYTETETLSGYFIAILLLHPFFVPFGEILKAKNMAKILLYFTIGLTFLSNIQFWIFADFQQGLLAYTIVYVFFLIIIFIIVYKTLALLPHIFLKSMSVSYIFAALLFFANALIESYKAEFTIVRFIFVAISVLCYLVLICFFDADLRIVSRNIIAAFRNRMCKHVREY